MELHARRMLQEAVSAFGADSLQAGNGHFELGRAFFISRFGKFVSASVRLARLVAHAEVTVGIPDEEFSFEIFLLIEEIGSIYEFRGDGGP